MTENTTKTQNNIEIRNLEQKRITEFDLTVTESKPFEIPVIEDGVYPAKLEDIELKLDVPDGKGGTFNMLQWNFDLEGIKITGKSSTIISNLSKANSWIKAITGSTIATGGKFSPSMVEGKQCQVVVKHQSRVINNEKVEMPYIDDVLPVKKNGKK